MKCLTSLALALAVAQAAPAGRTSGFLYGIDMSNWEPVVDWKSVANSGIKFAYAMSTDGTSYKSPYFNDQYDGAANVGLIRGAYHFARPDASSGAVQAKYFLQNRGGWSADGITLPGMLDMEYNPEGDVCYNLKASEMDSWINDFSQTYEVATGRYPVIYTTTDWWKTCTSNSASFGYNNPLWIALDGFYLGELPAGWSYATFWQYANNAIPNPGDADVFFGDLNDLERFARGG